MQSPYSRMHITYLIGSGYVLEGFTRTQQGLKVFSETKHFLGFFTTLFDAEAVAKFLMAPEAERGRPVVILSANGVRHEP